MAATGADIASDDEGAAALATVLRVAEEGDGTVARPDVRGDVDRERWGAMLEQGVLVPADTANADAETDVEGRDDRFVLEDPVGVRETLEKRAFAPPEPEGWGRTDFAAVAAACSLVAGYRIGAIRDAVAAALDLALGPIATALPFPAVVLLLAVATTVAAAVVRRRVGQPDSTGLRHRTRELRARLAAARARGDDATVDRLAEQRRDLAATQALLLTDHLKVLAWTMLFTVPVFLYLSWLVASPARAAAPLVTVAPALGELVWTARVVGPVQAWMAWYALCSIASSLAARGVGRVVPDRFEVPS